MLLQSAFRLLLSSSILLGALLPLTRSNPPSAGAAAAPDSSHVDITHSSVTGLTFRLSTPTFFQSEDGSLQAEGLNARIHEPGSPALPYFAAYVALPPEATAAITVHESDGRRVPAQIVVPPAPAVNTVGETDIAVMASQPDSYLDFRRDGSIYNSDAVFPETLHSISEPMYLRDLRLVELRLFPLRYNPVAQTVEHSRQLEVSITFLGADLTDLNPVPAYDDAIVGALSDAVLNFDIAGGWRSRPHSPASGETKLPVGSDAYRIEVNQDGIYELSYTDLAIAGMPVDSVDPNTFQMLYRGLTVAYDFVGDADNRFEPGEAVRFFGWEFDGSRLERQFIPDNRNYYWLWAGGSPTQIADTGNPTSHPVPDSFPESITLEEELLFQLTRTDSWDSFPNEPDAWYLTGIEKPSASPVLTRTIELELPDPAGSGPDAVLTAEVLNRTNETWQHSLEIFANDAPQYAAGAQWLERQNINIVATTPITSLVDGDNTIGIVVRTGDNASTETYYVNRVTVDYPRRFSAIGNLLQFSVDSGPNTFVISGFNAGNPDNAVVWDVTNHRIPRLIPMTADNISGSGPYQWTFGSVRTSGEYIATTSASLLNPLEITRYDVPNIEPPAGGADWVAISYADFLGAANNLATHRAQPAFGSLKKHVVNYADVINQYGYGFPVPAAIRDYLDHGLQDWSPAPTYALLVGDATYNPRQLPCAIQQYGADCVNWGSEQAHFVITDVTFKDRYSGLSTSDYTFVLMDDDLLPELGIGRLAVESPAEAEAVVAKIIDFETQHVEPSPWRRKILFVADAFDPMAGDFCAENHSTSTHIPSEFLKIHMCLPDNPSAGDTDNLRAAMRELMVNHPDDGVTLLNYRGHGSVRDWGKNYAILSANDTSWWYPTIGEPNPVIITSMDCLDGNHAYPGVDALSETFLALDGAGSVAHWSSTGLGVTPEHTALATRFYDGLFSENQTAIGDAINYAKVHYVLGGWHESELYSFLLQGDPAMQVFRPDLSLDKGSSQFSVEPGEQVTFRLTIENEGLYASRPTVVDTLPNGLSYVSATASAGMTVSISGNKVTMEFVDELARGEVITIDLVAELAAGFAGDSVTNGAVVSGVGGLDGNTSNNSDSHTVLVGASGALYLPIMSRQ